MKHIIMVRQKIDEVWSDWSYLECEIIPKFINTDIWDVWQIC